MALTGENGLSAADVAAVVGGNGNGGNFGWGDGSFWIIVLFLFAMMGGWGNGYGNGGGGTTYVANDVQRGFDQTAVMSGINGLTTAVSNGFANAEVSRCNANTNLLQALNGISMAQQNCCCENRAAVADLKYTVAQEACSDRAAISDALRDVVAANTASTQRILDQMCQDKIDAKNEQIAALQQQLTMAQLAASQNAQTAAILANNEAQTAALEQYLNPTPIPAYVVQNPNCCTQNYGCGCGTF